MLLFENWDMSLEMCGNTQVGQTATLRLIRAFDEARLLERINDPLFVHRKIIVLW